eukprot:1585524-Rhodomonas_salina.2
MRRCAAEVLRTQAACVHVRGVVPGRRGDVQRVRRACDPEDTRRQHHRVARLVHGHQRHRHRA